MGRVTATEELIVLLDDDGTAIGTMPKPLVHHGETPLHRAFSAYLFDDRGRLLITRRAADKQTFPGMWTNTVCGHPGPGEDDAAAIARRATRSPPLPGSATRSRRGGGHADPVGDPDASGGTDAGR